jgi:hypothetical protein
VAVRLYAALDADRATAGIADIWQYGSNVEMELASGEYWAIECLGPNAFHLYPGVVREETVTWVNVWVAADYTLEVLVERLDETLVSAKSNGKKCQ